MLPCARALKKIEPCLRDKEELIERNLSDLVLTEEWREIDQRRVFIESLLGTVSVTVNLEEPKHSL